MKVLLSFLLLLCIGCTVSKHKTLENLSSRDRIKLEKLINSL